MKNKLYIFTAILVSLFSLTSCGLEEPYTPEKNPDAVIEFVGRPVGFNNQDVDTKSAASGIENTVNACYFLLFDATTGGILYRTGGDAESLQNFRIPKTELAAKGTTSVTACYLVNVPKTFAEGLKYLEKTSSAASGKNPGDNECLSTAVIDIPSYQSGTPMGVPVIDGKAGIPMYGKATFSLEGNTNTEICQIPVKRLFAKITVDISLALSLEGWDQIIQSSTYYKLNRYNLHNLPKKVCLEEKAQETESSWAGVKSSFAYTDAGSNPSGSLNQSIVYNNSGNYEFSFYVPEYYLSPKTTADNNQKNKPNNYRDGGLPVYITLHGSYTEYSYRDATMQHKIYLGRNEHSDFSFVRNTHYTNYLIINGVSGNENGEGDNLDWRVVTEVVHNPVEVEGKSANCYIITKEGDEGKYSFPAYKGAYNDLQNAELCSGDDDSQVVQLASDNNNIKLIELDYDADKNFISFKVDNIDDGNVVIALENKDGSIEWSWHLWCSPSSVIGDWFQNMTNITGAWGDMSFQTYPNGSKMMDRNLGASGSTSAGPYFKYGSKNPYISNDYYGGGTNGNLTWDPSNDANTDDNTKAVNDPCPPGYKIPPVGSWTTGAGKTGTSSVLFVYNLANPNVTLYYNGYVYYDSNNKRYEQEDAIEEEHSYLLENYSLEPTDLGNLIPEFINQTGGTLSRNKTRTRVDQITEYYDFEYNAKTSSAFNRFWYLDGQAFHYEYASVDWSKILQGAFVVTKCKTKKYKKYQDQKSTNYGVSYTNVGDPYYGDYEYGEKTSGLSTYALTIYNQVRGKNLAKSDAKVVANADYGYQVRCIKDE